MFANATDSVIVICMDSTYIGRQKPFTPDVVMVVTDRATWLWSWICVWLFTENSKNNLNCRACGHLEESQYHILNQCHKIHTTDQSRIKPDDYFEDDPELLKKTAYNIETVMTLLESYNTSQANKQNTRRTNPTNTTRGASTSAPPSDGEETAQQSGCTY